MGRVLGTALIAAGAFAAGFIVGNKYSVKVSLAKRNDSIEVDDVDDKLDAPDENMDKPLDEILTSEMD